MPNRLLEALRGQYTALSDQYDAVLTRCADEGRDPSEVESGLLEGLSNQMEPLGERIVALRDTDSRRLAAMTALSDYPTLPGGDNPELFDAGDRTPVVRVRSEELVYRRDGGPEGAVSFFRDLVSLREGDRTAADRLERHAAQTRALGTTTTGAGAVPPVWLPEEFAALAHGPRPTADTFRRIPITSATPINIGVQTAGAVVGRQAAEGNEPADGSFVAAPIIATPDTVTGKVDVSRQLLDGSNPAVDSLLYGDLMGAYAEDVEQRVVTALLAAAAALGNAGDVPIDLDADDPRQYVTDGVTDAAILVRKARKMTPRAIFMTYGTWGVTTKQRDAAGRPLVIPGRYGAQNVSGLGDAVVYDQVAGEIAGLAVVPSWAGNDAKIVVAKADDLLLFESSTMSFRYEEVLGPQTIRLGVWGYVAIQARRYLSALATVTLSGAAIAAAAALAGAGGSSGPDDADEAPARSRR